VCQTNSLLWKLLQHIVNCVKFITRSTIDYLKYRYIVIVDYISSLFTIFIMAVRRIDFQLRDLLYLNIFLLVIYEIKKTNKKQLVHLTKYYESEITSMELLLKHTNGAYKLEMNNMENSKFKEKLRSAELVKEQQNKYDKFKKVNNQLAPSLSYLPPPFFKHSLPPPPLSFKHSLSRPPTCRLNACQPFINKPLSAVPKRLSTVRINSALTARKSVKPIVQLPLFAPISQQPVIAPIIQRSTIVERPSIAQRPMISPILERPIILERPSIAQRPLIAPIIQRPPIAERSSIAQRSLIAPFVQRPPIAIVQQDKIDSLQFFGCPDNYTRPPIRVN